MKKLLLAGLTVTTIAATPAFAQRACLQIDSIYNWNAVDDKTLIVEDNWHKKFKLKLIGACYDLKFHEALAFKSVGTAGIGCTKLQASLCRNKKRRSARQKRDGHR